MVPRARHAASRLASFRILSGSANDVSSLRAAAEELLQASRIGVQILDVGDQVWLNRHLLEASFRQATGRACFRRLNSGLDCAWSPLTAGM